MLEKRNVITKKLLKKYSNSTSNYSKHVCEIYQSQFTQTEAQNFNHLMLLTHKIVKYGIKLKYTIHVCCLECHLYSKKISIWTVNISSRQEFHVIDFLCHFTSNCQLKYPVYSKFQSYTFLKSSRTSKPSFVANIYCQIFHTYWCPYWALGCRQNHL